MTNYNKDGDSTPKNNNQKTNEKQSIAEFKKVIPWHETVDGKTLFDDLTNTFKKYLALQKYQAETLALWAISSYCYDANNIAPKLLIHSPEKRCGKTTLLDVLSEVVWQPIMASNITPAVIFRVIESTGGTIMIDEADTFIKGNMEMTGIINSGHRKKHAIVWRCHGENNDPKAFSTWAPMVISMIGKPQDTIVDRSIVITMQRKRLGEKVERVVQHKLETETEILARKISRWSKDNFDDLKESDPQTPEGLNDRAADNWRPLLAIADLIGNDCGLKMRIAALELNKKDVDEEDSSIPTMLLNDIHDVFQMGKEERLSTQTLLGRLHQMEERPWIDWNHGRAITPNQIARYLKPFCIKPKKMRIYNSPTRGYEREQFEDAFTRYLDGTSEQSNRIKELEAIQSGTVPTYVPEEMFGKSLKNNDCSIVPFDEDKGKYDHFFDDE